MEQQKFSEEQIAAIQKLYNKCKSLQADIRWGRGTVNGAEIPEDLKLKLQGYITGCYGTLTSFNILFAEEEDRFRGSSGAD